MQNKAGNTYDLGDQSLLLQEEHEWKEAEEGAGSLDPLLRKQSPSSLQ